MKAPLEGTPIKDVRMFASAHKTVNASHIYNSTIIGYYIGRYEAVFITVGKSGKVYILEAERKLAKYKAYGGTYVYEERDAKHPFHASWFFSTRWCQDYIKDRTFTVELKSVTLYIQKAKNDNIGLTLVPHIIMKDAAADLL